MILRKTGMGQKPAEKTKRMLTVELHMITYQLTRERRNSDHGREFLGRETVQQVRNVGA